jgi:hypothetical protein
MLHRAWHPDECFHCQKKENKELDLKVGLWDFYEELNYGGMAGSH